ncbi:MAG: hypothetical protein C0485_12165 [Pirellula sp.]|nr:hypothetical protein [Pirellula sp.]
MHKNTTLPRNCVAFHDKHLIGAARCYGPPLYISRQFVLLRTAGYTRTGFRFNAASTEPAPRNQAISDLQAAF